MIEAGRINKEIIKQKVFNLEGSLKFFLANYQEEINAYEYDLVVSDEASARIPSLILWRTIKNIYQDQQILLPLQYISGDNLRMGNSEERNLGSCDKKAILLTEYVHNGHTVTAFDKFFAQNNKKFDLCIMTMARDRKYLDTYCNFEQSPKIAVYAQEEKHPPAIYKDYRLSGVIDVDGSVYPEHFASNTQHIAKRATMQVAKNLTQWFNSKKKAEYNVRFIV